MYFRLLSMVFFLIIFTSQFCHSSSDHLLQEDQVKSAIYLNSSQVKFEDYLNQEKTENEFSNKNWFTLENNFSFKYKESEQEFCMAHGFYCKSNWGEIALYPKDTDSTKIKYMFGRFSDLGRGVEPYIVECDYVLTYTILFSLGKPIF
ncbi:MAG: hypothetical protein ACRYGR_07615 [Janthinobacterium lividum]